MCHASIGLCFHPPIPQILGMISITIQVLTRLSDPAGPREAQGHA